VGYGARSGEIVGLLVALKRSQTLVVAPMLGSTETVTVGA